MSYHHLHPTGQNTRTLFSLFAVIALLALLMAANLMPLAQGQTEPALTEDWPKFRHNMYNTGVNGAEAPESDELYWVFEAPMGQYDFFGFVSSPAVIDHIIYAGCANGYVYAIDEASGKKLWEFVVDDWIDGVPFPHLVLGWR